VGAGRVRISGPPVQLPAKQALALSLALHELCTNALKYGALSGDKGQVALAWGTEPGRLAISWRETDGSPVAARREGDWFPPHPSGHRQRPDGMVAMDFRTRRAWA
jgi:two-component sensor histidine kinase